MSICVNVCMSEIMPMPIKLGVRTRRRQIVKPEYWACFTCYSSLKYAIGSRAMFERRL